MAYVRLARLKQWSKGVFVLIGPAYGLADGREISIIAVLAAFVCFGCCSSLGYIVNDIADREADKLHPRKRKRPIASGAIGVAQGVRFAWLMGACAALALGVVWLASGPLAAGLTGLASGAYVANALAYSMLFKKWAIADVLSLSGGFVLRVLGGCAAAGIAPSTWLLNCTLFLSMYLAFGKRMGERRTLGSDAVGARAVQSAYTDDLLRMLMVMSGIATLLSYAAYVQGREEMFGGGVNLLWFTTIPATFGLLRSMLLLERGVYDDPTELAASDWPSRWAIALFGVITLAAWAST